MIGLTFSPETAGDVSMCAIKPTTGTFELSGKFSRHHRVDDAKLADAHVLHAQRRQLFREQVREVELLARAGHGRLIFSRLRVDLHVTKKPIQRRFSRRLERSLRVGCYGHYQTEKEDGK